MADFLVDFAIDNFWCNPEQDKQGIFKLARISQPYGAVVQCKVMLENMAMPTTTDTYHVFQFGQIDPFFLGLISQSPTWAFDPWQTLGDTINILPVFIDVYNTNGIHIPRFEVYYRFTSSKDLIIVIKQNTNIPVNYGIDDIYLRVYSNAYFQKVTNTPNLYYSGGTFSNSTDLLNFQILYNTYASKTGAVFCYNNGLLIDSISLVTCQIGSTCEFIYDSSVKRQFTVPMNAVQTFTSILDRANKYLLHDSGAANTTINYQDDIEIYITNPVSGHYTGVYYHRNAADSHRMVTHRDYAINVNYATSLMQAFKTLIGSGITNLNQLSFLVMVRNSGFNHSLVYENNRITDLYKLADTQVQQALTGVNSNNPVWQAANLENSFYTQVMRSWPASLNDQLIQNALGYNAYSKYTADTPSAVYSNSGALIANVPVGLQSNYCAYEYSTSGTLNTYSNTISGSTYNVVNSGSANVEMIYGAGGNTAPAYFGTTGIIFNSNTNYRVYRCNMLNTSVPDNLWVDVTDSGNYSVSGSTLTWNLVNDSQYIMVRTDERIVNYDLSLVPQDGILEFTLTETQNREGVINSYPMTVPMSDIVLFLNGNTLVNGIDYIIQGTQVVIINTKYLIHPANSTAQSIHVRMSGFCNADLTYNKPYDTGFIMNNALSSSYRFDILDDTVNRVSIGGDYLSRATLQISDTSAGVTLASGYNGLPYSIEKPMVPIENLYGTDLLTYIGASKTIDTQVSDYLSLYLTKANEPLSSMPALYPVLSPFIANIVLQLYNGNAANTTLITATMTDNDIITFCQPYLKWLAFDPITTANTIDPRFISIVPTNLNAIIQLPLLYYSFIQRVIKLYAMNPMVSLSSYVQLKSL